MKTIRLIAAAFVLFPLLWAAPTRGAAAWQAWAQRFSRPLTSADWGSKVVTDAKDNVIVAGYSSAGGVLAIKYSDAGIPLWTNQPGLDGFWPALAVDGSGDVVVAGYSWKRRGFVTLKYSEAGLPLWTNRYNGPRNADFVSAVAVDSSGNVFVTGESYGLSTNSDYATVAYSGAGVPLWTNRYNGPANSNDVPVSLAVDGAGNVCVTGYSTGTNGFDDYATIMYSGGGVPLWTNRYGGPGNGGDQAVGLAIDGSRNVFVTGSYSSCAWSGCECATIKYSPDGLPLWTNRYQGAAATAIGVDAVGNVFVTGYSGDFMTIAYSGEGLPLWTNHYRGPSTIENGAAALRVDASGDVSVTGYSYGTVPPLYTATDYATVKYSNAGIPLWTNRYHGALHSREQPRDLAVDSKGNVVVTGESVGTIVSERDFAGCLDRRSDDVATIKYAADGTALWTNRYDAVGSSDDQPLAVAVDKSGSIFVTGYSIATNGFRDYATIKYSNDGVPLWTNYYNGPADSNDMAHAVAVDSSGNVFVAGASALAIGTNGFATIAYSTDGIPLWTNRYDGARTVEGVGIVVDAGGNVFVTGNAFNASGYGCVTIKYSGAGLALWTNSVTGHLSPVIAADNNGDIIVAGNGLTIRFSNDGLVVWTNQNAGLGGSFFSVAVDSSGNTFVSGPYAVIGYSRAGVPLWTNALGGAVAVDEVGSVFVARWSSVTKYSGAGVPLWTNSSPGASAEGLAVDSRGSVIVTGRKFGPDPYTQVDFLTIGYANDGVPLWTNSYNGPVNGKEYFYWQVPIAIGPDDSVVISGSSDGDNTFYPTYDFATVKYVIAYSPQISLPPADMMVPIGGRASFTVAANGVEPLWYQWRKDGIALMEGGNVFGSATATLCLTSVQLADAGEYDLVLTNNYGAITSAVAVLIVKQIVQLGNLNATLDPTAPVITFTGSGSPDLAWAIERALDVSGPWTNIGSMLIGTNGSGLFQDIDPPLGSGFYRARKP